MTEQDRKFLRAMRIQTDDGLGAVLAGAPPAICAATPQIQTKCEGGEVRMSLADFHILLEANHALAAEGQAWARESEARGKELTTVRSDLRAWRGACVLLAVGVMAVTVWGLVR